MKPLKKAVTAAVLALPVALGLVVAPATPAAAASLPCTPETLSNCPKPGIYTPRGDKLIHQDARWSLRWTRSVVVEPPSGQVPQWLHVKVTYRNDSGSILYFTCRGWEDPQLSKEWFLRDGQEIGYVAADETLCSTHPDLNFTLGPGRSFVSWAKFHNVPWRGDRISVEWGSYGRSDYLDPYGRRNH